MADTKQDFAQLEGILSNLGQSLKGEALQRVIAENQMRQRAEDVAFRQKEFQAGQYDKQQALDQARADRIHAQYQQTYEALKATHPTSTPEQIQAEVVKQMPPDATNLLTRYYGIKFGVPTTASTTPPLNGGSSNWNPKGPYQEGGIGQFLHGPRPGENSPEMNEIRSYTAKHPESHGLGVPGFSPFSELNNISTPMGPVNPTPMTPYAQSKLLNALAQAKSGTTPHQFQTSLGTAPNVPFGQ